MKEAKTIGQLLTEGHNDIVVKFVNDENQVTHRLEVLWSRKNGYPSLSQDVLNTIIKFIVNEYGDTIVYC